MNSFLLDSQITIGSTQARAEQGRVTPMPRVTRSPSHAGSWYAVEAGVLTKEIGDWLSKAREDGEAVNGHAQAIIGP